MEITLQKMVKLFILSGLAVGMQLAALQVALAQGVVLKGKITDNQKQGLPGVSVIVKGTTNGTFTDAEGKYSLAVTGEDKTLFINHMGYLSQEIDIAGQTTVDVSMLPDTKALSEVVVVGYGTQTKSQVTGAISSVSSKQITELPITNARQALQGRAAGVDVIQSGSQPGGGVTVRIRGRRSITASNDPLYVVDGIPLVGNIDDMNPNDFAGMEILKDASATAIYGARGANGIVIITTKRGKPGKTVVSYDAYYGVSQALGRTDVMDGAQFAEYKRESRRAVGQYDDSNPVAADKALFEPIELDGIATGRSTDYQSLLLRTGKIQSHHVGIQGGSANTQFYLAANYFQDKGIIIGQDFTRYSFRINLDHQITNRIKVGTSTFAVYSLNNGANSFFDEAFGFAPYGGALQENPLGKPFDGQGNLIFLPTSDGLRTNPASEVVPGANMAETKTIRIFNSLYGEWNIVKGLKYRFNFGPDFINKRFGRFTGSLTNARRGGEATGRVDYGQRFNYTIENILTYDKIIKEVHAFNITALHSIQRDSYEAAQISANGIPAETQQFYNLGQASAINPPFTGLIDWTIQSFMGRINYGFKEKYLLTLTARSDGSSRFGKNHKYGFFPSVAVAWNLSKEAPLQHINWLDQLKLRASYGSVGNADIAPYQTQTLLGRTVYAFGTTGAFGYRPSQIGNDDLRWEGTTTANVGLDFSMLAGRISGSLEFYQANTYNLLLYDQLPISNGFDRVLRNVGSTRNRGVELTLSTVNMYTNSGFKWSTDLQFTHNREAILELFNGKVNDIGNQRFIGQPLQVYYDKEKIGIWQLGQEDAAKSFKQNVGEIKLRDISGPNGVPDGQIDDNYDRKVLGSTIPDWTGGITNRFEFKGIDLSFFIYARVGNMIRSGFHNTFNSLSGRFNNLDVDYWTPTNPTNEFPRPNKSQEFPPNQTTLLYFSGSFVKVRNINIGYNLPSTIVQKLKMGSLRVYASIQQPFIFAEYRSKYKGIDPETTDIVNDSQTPSVKQFTFGMNATF